MQVPSIVSIWVAGTEAQKKNADLRPEYLVLPDVCNSKGEVPDAVLVSHGHVFAETNGCCSGGRVSKACEDNAQHGVVCKEADDDLAGD